MRKALWTVCVDHYAPSVTQYSIPILRAYAQKIGAEFNIITERKFPDWPATYEKLQIFKDGTPYDQNILIDADFLLSPSLPDLTQRVPAGHIGYYMGFDASLLFAPDPYFLRDGRRLGVSTNFMIADRWCHDVWTPLEFNFQEAQKLTSREFILDEYCVSRNIARYGMHVTGLMETEEADRLTKHLDWTTATPSEAEAAQTARYYHSLWGNLIHA